MKWLRIRRWLVQRLGGETYWLDDEIEEIERDQRRDGLKIIDMDEAITLLDPDVSQFETILMKLSRAADPATKISWLEDELFPRLQPDPDVWFDGVWVE